MYTGNKSKPVAVWIFTFHDDGKLNVAQTVIDKEDFSKVQRGMSRIAQWVRDNMKIAHKCPYSPNNLTPIEDDEGGETITEK